MKMLGLVLALIGLYGLAWGADAPGSMPKGTVCFSNSLRNSEQIPIACKGLGRFSTVAEIYERGYRVVSTGVIAEGNASTVFLIVEERR